MTRRSRARPWLVALIAAFAAIAVAACGSSSSKSSSKSGSASSSASSGGSGAASSGPGKGKPAIVLGDKNFTEEYILGYLYQYALQGQGYTVNLKPNIGSSELVNTSLTSGKIDMYPEYTGVIDTVLAGQSVSNPSPTAQAAYVYAQKYENKHGFTLLNKTPYFNADAIAVRPAYAKSNNLKTIPDLAKLKHWTYGGPVENKTRYEGVVGLQKAYHLHNFTFIGLQEGQAYPALDSGKINAAAVFTTDGQLLQKSKYVLLTDTKNIFGFQNVAPVVRTTLLKKEGPAFAATLNKVSALLTNHVMQTLNADVALNQQSPSVVAKKFLQANGIKT